MRRRWKLDRLSWRLGITVTSLVGLATVGTGVIFYRLHYKQILELTRRHVEGKTELIRNALEYQMLQEDRGLIRQLVVRLAAQPNLKRVMILDRKGQVQFTSDPTIGKHHFSFASPTCQVCHSRPANERQHSTVLETAGGSVLRCVQPIPNRSICHDCHNPRHRMNGVIIVDSSLEPTRRELAGTIRKFSLGTGAAALVLMTGIGLAYRRTILGRLTRFEQTARAIAHGDHRQRVHVTGNDPLTRVEEQFNQMADATTGLLADLRRQRASLEKVMNSVDDGLVVLDQSRRVVAANDSFARRFPDTVGQPLGLTCCQGASPGDGSFNCGCGQECPTLRCFRTGAVQMAIRTRSLADGTARQEEVRCSPVYDDLGQIALVVEVWRDITDRRSAEAHLADYRRMVSLGVLASAFSHELNTPLASIATCLAGIRRLRRAEGDGADETQDAVAEYVRIAETQVQRCGSITEQFLSLARGQSLTREVIDLPSCLEVVARLAHHAATDLGVAVVVFQPDGPRPAVLANGSAVQQVLLNLVLNAVHASRADTTVSLTCRSENGHVEVAVRDQGRGIAPADVPHLFEPFFHREARGSGLGLFVSMNLARSWGGDIQVTSALGQGSTFTLIFPASPT